MRCYACGRPILGGDGVEVDLAPDGQAFAEPALIHQRCSPLTLERVENRLDTKGRTAHGVQYPALA